MKSLVNVLMMTFLTSAITVNNSSSGVEDDRPASSGQRLICGVPYFSQSPVIDGIPDDNVWSKAAYCESTGPEESSSLPRLTPFRFAMGYDDSTLYGAFVCEDPPAGDPSGAIGSDTLMFAIDSLGAARSYFIFAMQRKGGKTLAVRYAEGNRSPDRFIHENRTEMPPLTWPGEWEYNGFSENGRWSGEFRIPLRMLSVLRPDIHTPIGMNVMRETGLPAFNDRQMESWARMLVPWALNSFSPVNFGRLRFLAPEGGVAFREPDYDRNERITSAWRDSDSTFRSPKIAKKSGGYDITLGNGMTIELHVSDGRFLGLGAVRVKGRELRNPSRPLTFELWEPDGEVIGTAGYQVKDVRIDGPHAVVELDVLGETGSEGIMEIRLAPAMENIGDAMFTGFASACRVRTEQRYVGRLIEHDTWELDGNADGCSLHLQTGNTYPVNRLTTQSLFRVHSDTYGGWNQCFDLQTGRNGSIFMGYRVPALVLTSIAKYPGEDVIHYINVTVAGRSRDMLTPQREVLFAPFSGAEADLWRDAFDFQSERMRRFVGIRETEVVPTSWLPLPYLFDNRGDYREIADQEIPKLAELGFKRLILPPIWRSHTGVCVSWDLTIDPKSGGEEGLAYLVEKAHEHGMTVVSWLGTAMYYRGFIPYYHPEWVAHNLDGSGMDTHYNELRVMNFRSPWAAYFLDSLRKVREKTGMDGYWIDSWSTFGCHAVDYAVPDARPHIEELLRALADLQNMGYTDILLEGIGPFGVSASWLYKGLFDHPEYSYKTSFYGGTFNADQYYRFLANKSTPHIGQPGGDSGVGVKVDKVTHEKSYLPDEDLLRKGRANRDYNAVCRYMKHASSLPNDRGVLWTDPDTGIRVLFAFQSFDGRDLHPEYITDVTTGGKPEKPRKFIAEPWHTYIFSKQAKELGHL